MGIKYLDGFSESAWRSLAVKAQRIGWPEGLRQAQFRIGKSNMKASLTCGMFEDTFPPEQDLAQAMAEVKALDYEAICGRQTHHGRGFTPEFYRIRAAAVAAAKEETSNLYAQGKARNLWLPPRCLNCFWTWLFINPSDSLQPTRTLDFSPWEGMPLVMLDQHTIEGKQRRVDGTVLSGSYDQHEAIGRRVMREGWSGIRRETHRGGLAVPAGPVQAEINLV